MRKPLLLLAALALTGCGQTLAPHAAPPAVQYIGTLNPAVTQQTIGSTICVTGWTATVRPPKSWTGALKRKQLPAGTNPAGYEEDHLMPLELGGAPKDPANLKPIPLKRAQADDVWETRLRKQVCSGTLTLAEARTKITEVKHGE